ncbi:MAG: ferritin-like domain-containing protein, partial [Thiohalobacterales bacterium]|nr:ferritin-like domain-containing protein [Thiohalobacterales bacterium]
MADLFELGRACLESSQPADKVAQTAAACRLLRDGRCIFDPQAPPLCIDVPGRPERPLLVRPSALPQRKLTSDAGRAAFIQALAHIEFNAINLAWDAVLRFRGLPASFYRDWARVAEEEALHFRLLNERLQALGFAYGDFPAHDGLWEMAVKTAADVLLRMALVPRVLEARGLDVTPAMIARLQQAGDADTAAILQRIYTDEIGHVQIGSHWFRHICSRRGLEPAATFRQLLLDYRMDRIKAPLNETARAQAGFDPAELRMLRG